LAVEAREIARPDHQITGMRRSSLSLSAALALAVALALTATPVAATELFSRGDGGSGLGAGVDRARSVFDRQQLESDLRTAQQRRQVLEGRRPSQLATGLDAPESDAFADFRALEAEQRRLERRERQLESRLSDLPADPADRIETEVDQPEERPPFPDQASFNVPRGLEGVDIPESREARRERARAFVNDLLQRFEARGEY
jgi:hypothetical protein